MVFIDKLLPNCLHECHLNIREFVDPWDQTCKLWYVRNYRVDVDYTQPCTAVSSAVRRGNDICYVIKKRPQGESLADMMLSTWWENFLVDCCLFCFVSDKTDSLALLCCPTYMCVCVCVHTASMTVLSALPAQVIETWKCTPAGTRWVGQSQRPSSPRSKPRQNRVDTKSKGGQRGWVFLLQRPILDTK